MGALRCAYLGEDGAQSTPLFVHCNKRVGRKKLPNDLLTTSVVKG